MTQSAWRIATDTNKYVADDLSGAGAEITGGRWNEPGMPMLYCAQSRALACLETMVHLNTVDLPLNRYLVEIEIPDDIWAAAQVETPASLPVGWEARPAGRVSLAFGSEWIASRRSLILVVPSVIVHEESAILINPRHPDLGRLGARKVRRWEYDARLPRTPTAHS